MSAPATAAPTGASHARPRRVPSVLQMEAVECGAAALAMVLAYHGRYVPLEELRVACGVSRDGSNAVSILTAARGYGLTAAGAKVELDELPAAAFPLIAFWDFNHFVAVEGTAKAGLCVNDPASGRRVVPWDDADARFTGVVLTFEPGPDFVRQGGQPSTLRALAARLTGSWSGVWYLLLAGLALIVPLMGAPIATQLFTDNVLVPAAPNQAAGILAALAVMIGAQAWLLWWQATVINRFDIRLSVMMAAGFFRHALRLPLTFYAQRSVSDVAYRLQLGGEVAQVVSGQLAPALLQVFTAALYLVLMVLLSPLLTVVALVAAAVDIVVLRVSRRHREDASGVVVREESGLSATSYYGLRTIESVKASGGEDDLFGKVTGFHARAANARQRLEVPYTVVSAIPALTAQLANICVVSLGALLVLRGQLTLGQLMAFSVLVVGFLNPIGVLVSLGGTVQQARGHLERIDDLLRYPTPQPPPVPTELPMGRLRGEVELRDVTFGYNPGKPPLLDGFSLHVQPGQRIALVGGSGSGKTTVARIITGLVTPWSGEVRFDGLPRDAVPAPVLAASLALVDQDIVLFAGTVRDNVSFLDRTLPDPAIVGAARDAAIHADISVRPGGYGAAVADGGRNFSGGQQQRIEIARALAVGPSILVLDEATSALDPGTEQEIDQALRRRACTTVVVAHRLSTIRDCDEIIVLDHGKVAERGTHDQLMRRDGAYARLVTS
ncbi:MAG TPA: NHLP family bacteriocin export ABC transporter peptidase/permease/ATPase subunit [Pilimelia sp.]|nr:NHLP family bacteriocin export ABC transporter peptidase/permease/ATPase subunit [Pilimelia sp.]